MTNQNPEQLARDHIDKQLLDCGWLIQDKTKINLSAGQGIAAREYQTNTRPADYVLFVDKKPVGVIEAKKKEAGVNLVTETENQSADYAVAKLKYLDNDPLPFVYESTGEITRFTDYRDPKPRSRNVFTFHKPETFAKWLKEEKTLRARFFDLPDLNPDGLRDCQINAINKLDVSFKENRPKALIQMATGSGKTFTAITFIYRLLKFAKAKRVLFLVDTKNLGEQAEQEFMAFVPNDDNRKFTELYGVSRLKSSFVPNNSQVYISTIQRFYSILKGEEFGEENKFCKKITYNTDDPIGTLAQFRNDYLPHIAVGAREEDLFTSLAGRLARLEKQVTEKEKNTFQEKANGKTISQVVKELLNAYNPDTQEEIRTRAETEYANESPLLKEEKYKEQLNILQDKAASVFTGELNNYIENVRKAHAQVIDHIKPDKLLAFRWDKENKPEPRSLAKNKCSGCA